VIAKRVIAKRVIAKRTWAILLQRCK